MVPSIQPLSGALDSLHFLIAFIYITVVNCIDYDVFMTPASLICLLPQLVLLHVSRIHKDQEYAAPHLRNKNLSPISQIS
jgi:hypothetical protein